MRRHSPPSLPRMVLAAGTATVAYLVAELATWLAGPPAPPPVGTDARWRAGIAVGHQLAADTEEH